MRSKVHSEMEILGKTDKLITRYFQESRHVEDILGIKEDGEERDIWRKYSKERMKTVSVALVLCLHIGVDPPDSVPKPSARARLEAWVDPYSCSPQKAAYKIATSLQKSYERWQPRARYKSVIDPTGDDVRKICMSMRRNAKDERVLFHYNGHGVPRPTQNGEIWVFNKNFTQYIPLSLYDLQLCMEFPSIYVWDCSSAETIVNWFMRFAKDHEEDWHKKLLAHQEAVAATSMSGARLNSHMTPDQQAESLKFQRRPKFRECIHLAACREDERLPTNAELPADLFTSCLTTPIHASILWYLIKSGRKNQFPPNLLEEIPGQLNDRRTVLGELNWIFTAITDTIAWNALPRDDFQRLFRQDLLLASLFRSFLLAERVMSANGCNVVSSPSLPSTADHPLWDSWDYTLDLTLNHIQNLLTPKLNFQVIGRDLLAKSSVCSLNTLIDLSGVAGEQDVQHNWFFIEQLKAFEVWLEYGVNKQSSPEQLPIVLQVLLSQAHRQRALELLARFLDLGQWAVGYSLSVGIFPYVLKLLQSTSRELRSWLAFIWAKILAVDPSVQSELFKENGDEPARLESSARSKPVQLRYHFFVTILNDPDTSPRQKIVVAFVLATLFHNNYRIAQENLTKKGYVNLCTELLSENQAKDCRLLKLWILIGLGRLWADYDPARWQAVRLVAYAKVLKELDDNAPEVRAAAVYALGCLVKNRSETNEHASTIDQEICDDLCNKCTKDGSVLVREELLIALQWYIIDFEQRFAKLLWDLAETLGIELIADVPEDQFEHNVIDVAATLSNDDTSGRSPLQTSILRKSSVYRGRQRTSESIMGIEEVVTMNDPAKKSLTSSISQVLSVVSTYAGPSESDVSFRLRANKQLAYLESKNFKEPLERTWVALLKLALDPVEKVARMAQKLVRRVEMTAVDLQNSASAMTEKIESVSSFANMAKVDSSSHVHRDSFSGAEADASNNEAGDANRGGVRFMIGSPIATGMALLFPEANHAHSAAHSPGDNEFAQPSNGTLNSSSSTAKPFTSNQSRQQSTHQRKLSMPSQFPAASRGLEPRTSQLTDLLKQSFTPKRGTTARGEFSKGVLTSTAEPLLTTEFVPWCSRIFVQPILDLIYCKEEVEDFTDRALTLVNPTDWAIFVEQGQRQQAYHEFEHFRTTSCDAQLVFTRIPRCAASISLSMLRKCIYSTDGEQIYITRFEKSYTSLARKFSCNGDNPFNTDKTSSLIVINELSREMLLCGSSAGIVRVWDPSFNIHSHEIEGLPQLVTASNPLCDQSRLPIPEQGAPSTLYDWSQETGRLICGGNVRVIRVWDAHYEKTAQDIPVLAKKGGICALSGELDRDDLIAAGHRDGVVHVHDIRVPGKDSLVMSFSDLSSRVVGVAIRVDANGNAIVAAADEGGDVCVWEPRMIKGPVVEVAVECDADGLRDFAVHSNSEMLACVLKSEVKVYDIRGVSMSTIRHSEPASTISAVAMHKLRCMIAVASTDGIINLYGQPKTTL
ncbi:unnamed protein product [Cylicocyclus nassatus]|uniref:Raptor N-terminal CASPase-like domain-containing protein n=1 Tax=Cylicocyclus nassatus TaxID=53992 RepID=A0AA36H242_CYLNA|nr:unnamed protein product [Cylicocyclus nassatus]